jgi:hypothetical protein
MNENYSKLDARLILQIRKDNVLDQRVLARLRPTKYNLRWIPGSLRVNQLCSDVYEVHVSSIEDLLTLQKDSRVICVQSGCKVVGS